MTLRFNTIPPMTNIGGPPIPVTMCTLNSLLPVHTDNNQPIVDTTNIIVNNTSFFVFFTLFIIIALLLLLLMLQGLDYMIGLYFLTIISAIIYFMSVVYRNHTKSSIKINHPVPTPVTDTVTDPLTGTFSEPVTFTPVLSMNSVSSAESIDMTMTSFDY